MEGVVKFRRVFVIYCRTKGEKIIKRELSNEGTLEKKTIQK